MSGSEMQFLSMSCSCICLSALVHQAQHAFLLAVFVRDCKLVWGKFGAEEFRFLEMASNFFFQKRPDFFFFFGDGYDFVSRNGFGVFQWGKRRQFSFFWEQHWFFYLSIFGTAFSKQTYKTFFNHQNC